MNDDLTFEGSEQNVDTVSQFHHNHKVFTIRLYADRNIIIDELIFIHLA